jgi:hypothetical protein
MNAKKQHSKVRMSGWYYGVAIVGLLLVGALILTLAGEYFIGSGVHAVYPQGVSFTGSGHFSRMTCYGVAWMRDNQDPQPCPLVIHLSTGDMSPIDLSTPETLLARGWTKILEDKEPVAELPQILILQYREGDYAAHVYYADGILTTVTLGMQAVALAKPDARGIAVSFQGKRVPLPLPEGELLEILGVPTLRTRGAGY